MANPRYLKHSSKFPLHFQRYISSKFTFTHLIFITISVIHHLCLFDSSPSSIITIFTLRIHQSSPSITSSSRPYRHTGRHSTRVFISIPVYRCLKNMQLLFLIASNCSCRYMSISVKWFCINLASNCSYFKNMQLYLCVSSSP